MKKFSKIKIGIIFGIITGVIDVIPMIFQKLTWDASNIRWFIGYFVNRFESERQ